MCYRKQESAKELFARLVAQGMSPGEAQEQAEKKWIFYQEPENPEPYELETGQASMVVAFEKWLKSQPQPSKSTPSPSGPNENAGPEQVSLFPEELGKSRPPPSR